MELYVSTTGTQDPVILTDLGYRELDHPLTDYQLTLEFTYDELVNSDDFISAVENGHLTVKDEREHNLTVDDLVSEDLLDIQEDNSTVVQGANTINFEGDVSVEEESGGKATITIGDGSNLDLRLKGALYTSIFANNGNTGNRWLDLVHEAINSNGTFFIVPQTSRLVVGTFSNSENNANFKVNLWKLAVGETDINNKVLLGSWTFENARLVRGANITPEVTVNAGDKLAVFIEDIGATLKNVIVILYWQMTNFSFYDITSENFSGDLGDGSVI
jgi:hypothetical protein